MKAMRIFWSAGTAIGLVVAAPAFAAEETAPDSVAAEGDIIVTAQRRAASLHEIGRASCRESECRYVSISVVAVSLTKNATINIRITPHRQQHKNKHIPK